MRRDFSLSISDEEFLNNYGCDWETLNDGSQWVLLNNFVLPIGYTNETATVAIRLETGYPDTELDMVYFCPSLQRRDQTPIPATDEIQMIDGRSFQRWSRHRTAMNPWIPGQDALDTHIMLVEDWLEREFK